MQCGILGWIKEQKNTLVEKFRKTEEIDITIIVTGDNNVPFPHGLAAMWETWVPSLGWEDPLEKGKTTSLLISAEEALNKF